MTEDVESVDEAAANQEAAERAGSDHDNDVHDGARTHGIIADLYDQLTPKLPRTPRPTPTSKS